MKDKYLDFICNLHGHCIRVKEIHWATHNNSEHLLCDEIIDCIYSCEDRLTEYVMGMEGTHFKIGDLKPMLPNAKSLSGVLRELEDDIIYFRGQLKTSKETALSNILDDLQEHCYMFKYRATQS